jgi:hypothetical protein
MIGGPDFSWGYNILFWNELPPTEVGATERDGGDTGTNCVTPTVISHPPFPSLPSDLSRRNRLTCDQLPSTPREPRGSERRRRKFDLELGWYSSDGSMTPG